GFRTGNREARTIFSVWARLEINFLNGLFVEGRMPIQSHPFVIYEPDNQMNYIGGEGHHLMNTLSLYAEAHIKIYIFIVKFFLIKPICLLRNTTCMMLFMISGTCGAAVAYHFPKESHHKIFYLAYEIFAQKELVREQVFNTLWHTCTCTFHHLPHVARSIPTTVEGVIYASKGSS
ncbi:hypothetical protein ACJX0J_032965, partial [Zea mays]